MSISRIKFSLLNGYFSSEDFFQNQAKIYGNGSSLKLVFKKKARTGISFLWISGSQSWGYWVWQQIRFSLFLHCLISWLKKRRGKYFKILWSLCHFLNVSYIKEYSPTMIVMVKLISPSCNSVGWGKTFSYELMVAILVHPEPRYL